METTRRKPRLTKAQAEDFASSVQIEAKKLADAIAQGNMETALELAGDIRDDLDMLEFYASALHEDAITSQQWPESGQGQTPSEIAAMQRLK